MIVLSGEYRTCYQIYISLYKWSTGSEVRPSCSLPASLNVLDLCSASSIPSPGAGLETLLKTDLLGLEIWLLIPNTNGGSQPSVILMPEDLMPLLASVSSRHTDCVHTYMVAKHSYT